MTEAGKRSTVKEGGGRENERRIKIRQRKLASMVGRKEGNLLEVKKKVRE
jgi:hypothetical protein